MADGIQQDPPAGIASFRLRPLSPARSTGGRAMRFGLRVRGADGGESQIDCAMNPDRAMAFGTRILDLAGGLAVLRRPAPPGGT